MQLLVLVLNKTDCLDDILKEFAENGIKGATILDSMGMVRSILSNMKPDELPIFGSLKMILNERRPFSKTIFMVLKDEQVMTTITLIKKVLGDLSKPDTGIIFTIPISYVEGIIK